LISVWVGEEYIARLKHRAAVVARQATFEGAFLYFDPFVEHDSIGLAAICLVE
jgi:hypothetical protein